MNNTTKRETNVGLLLKQRLELFSEAGGPESGQATARTPGWRSIVGQLTSRLRTLRAGKEGNEPLSLGRDLEELVLIYAPGNEPAQGEALPNRETDRNRSVA